MIDHATLLTYLAVLTGFVLIPRPAVLLTLARAATSARARGHGDRTRHRGRRPDPYLHGSAGLSAILMTSAFRSTWSVAGAAYLVYQACAPS